MHKKTNNTFIVYAYSQEFLETGSKSFYVSIFGTSIVFGAYIVGIKYLLNECVLLAF